MSNERSFSLSRVLILAGAVIAFTIGSGFATGQEIIQYFTAYGWKGILTVLAILTVLGGLNSLVDKIGIVGPAIVILCIGIGVVSLFKDAGNIGAGLEIIRIGDYAGAGHETIKSAGSNWVVSGLSYAGFVLLWFASFTAALGAKNKKKEVEYGVFGGTIAICVAIILIMFAQIANINTGTVRSAGTFVWNADIPNLILAERIWEPFAAIFAIVVFAGIYTTAVPLLYNPCARFAKEGTKQFKLLTVILGVAGLVIGLFLPFRVLVNVIYVLNGYVGAVLILFMLWKNIKDIFLKKKY